MNFHLASFLAGFWACWIVVGLPLGVKRIVFRSSTAVYGPSPTHPAFLTEVVDLGTTYANRTVRFRFRIGADDGASID